MKSKITEAKKVATLARLAATRAADKRNIAIERERLKKMIGKCVLICWPFGPKLPSEWATLVKVGTTKCVVSFDNGKQYRIPFGVDSNSPGFTGPFEDNGKGRLTLLGR